VAIRITVWIQGLFSGFVTIGRYGKWLTDTKLLIILIRQMAALVRRALAEVCTVPVLLVFSGIWCRRQQQLFRRVTSSDVIFVIVITEPHGVAMEDNCDKRCVKCAQSLQTHTHTHREGIIDRERRLYNLGLGASDVTSEIAASR